MKFENGRVGELSYLNSITKIQAGHDFYLIYVLKGTATVRKDTDSWLLKENTLLCIQSARTISINPQGVCGLLRISENYVSLFDLREYMINCDPSLQDRISYQEVVKTLTELLTLTEEPSVSSTDLVAKITKLIEKLKNDFGKPLSNTGDLISQVEKYLELNFQQECSLTEVAHRFSVTPQYLSQRFKSQTGENFAKYLTRLRLEQSLLDLQHSNDLVLDVALRNGFSSLSTFNRTFKEKYHMSPGQYRNQHQLGLESEEQTGEVNNEELEASLTKMRLKNLQQQTIPLHADRKEAGHRPVFADTITLSQVPTSKIMEVLQRLRIRYVRMKLKLPDQIDNMYLLQVNHDIEPVLRTGLPIIWSIDDNSAEKLSNNLRRFFGYFANIISVENVAKWRIELSSQASSKIAEIKSAFNDLGIKPSFIIRGDSATLAGLSISEVAFNLIVGENQASAVVYQSKRLRQQFPHAELFVTYLGITKHNLRILNDTNFAAATFMKTAFKLSESADHIALAMLQDDEHQQLLDGQNGLTAFSMLRKPMFYAVSFFNRQSSQIFEIKENYLTSYDGRRNYSVLITNPSVVRSESTWIDYDNFHSILVERTAKKMVKVTGLANGCYMIKSRIENHYVGLTKLWKDLDQLPKLNLEEQDYLNRKSAPDMVIRQVEVKDHNLQFEFKMQADEVVYLHLIYLY